MDSQAASSIENPAVDDPGLGHDGGPPIATSSPFTVPRSGDSGNSSSGSTEAEKDKLLEGLSEDIYAMTVSSIFNGVRGRRLAKIAAAALFTAALQLGLLVVLWTAVTGKSQVAIDRDDSENVWAMLGQVGRQICWLNHVQEKQMEEVSRAINKSLNAKEWS